MFLWTDKRGIYTVAYIRPSEVVSCIRCRRLMLEMNFHELNGEHPKAFSAKDPEMFLINPIRAEREAIRCLYPRSSRRQGFPPTKGGVHGRRGIDLHGNGCVPATPREKWERRPEEGGAR
jgi:hypothetical protein